MGFSKDFLWGGATAANQYEGGVFEGGAGLATADVMTNGSSPGNMEEGRWNNRFYTFMLWF